MTQFTKKRDPSLCRHLEAGDGRNGAKMTAAVKSPESPRGDAGVEVHVKL